MGHALAKAPALPGNKRYQTSTWEEIQRIQKGRRRGKRKRKAKPRTRMEVNRTLIASALVEASTRRVTEPPRYRRFNAR